jgi:hypothetical protein
MRKMMLALSALIVPCLFAGCEKNIKDVRGHDANDHLATAAR